MANIWVYKFDGTIQCDTESKAVSLDAMRKQLGEILGFEKIVSMKKAARPMITLCGMPTGAINAYELTEDGWALLNDGIAGTRGFSRLDEATDEQAPQLMQLGGRVDPSGGSNPWPWSVREQAAMLFGMPPIPVGVDTWPWSVRDIPVSVRDLLGRKVRIVRPGDVVTQEISPGRVTIAISDGSRIEDIRIEPGLQTA